MTFYNTSGNLSMMGFFDRFKKKDHVQQTEQVTKKEETKPTQATATDDGGGGFEESQPKDD